MFFLKCTAIRGDCYEGSKCFMNELSTFYWALQEYEQLLFLHHRKEKVQNINHPPIDGGYRESVDRCGIHPAITMKIIRFKVSEVIRAKAAREEYSGGTTSRKKYVGELTIKYDKVKLCY